MVAEKATDTVAELERLRAENEALRQQVAAAEKVASTRSGRARNAVAAAVMIVATLALALSVPAVWINRMVTDTDYYVSTMAPLARDAAIQDAVAKAASDAAIEQLDLKTRLESRLPTELAFIAAPISSAADGFIREQATKFVRSDTFPQIWDKANEVSHQAFVTAVTGRETGAVQVEAGAITLDLGILVDKVAEQLSGAGFGLADKLPTGAVNKRITLYQSDALAQASVWVGQLQRIALILPLIGLALVGGAVALAENRRRVLLWLGGGLLVFTLLPLQAIYLGQSVVATNLAALGSIPNEAAQNAYGIIFAALIDAEQLAVGISLLVILAALLAGPSRWATALRGGINGGLSGVSSHLELGRFGVWVGARMAALRVVGYLIAAGLLVVLPRPRSMTQVWWIVGFVVVWLVAVQLIGSGAAPQPETAEPDAEPDDVSAEEQPPAEDA